MFPLIWMIVLERVIFLCVLATSSTMKSTVSLNRVHVRSKLTKPSTVVSLSKLTDINASGLLNARIKSFKAFILITNDGNRMCVEIWTVWCVNAVFG